MSQTGHFRPIDNVYAMSAYPPTAVELSQRSEPPLRATTGLSRFWSGRAEMGKILFRVRGAEIWKRRELDATSRLFSRPTWLDTAG